MITDKERKIESTDRVVSRLARQDAVIQNIIDTATQNPSLLAERPTWFAIKSLGFGFAVKGIIEGDITQSLTGVFAALLGTHILNQSNRPPTLEEFRLRQQENAQIVCAQIQYLSGVGLRPIV